MENILLQNGLVIDLDSETIEKKDILIESGKIKEIKENIKYEEKDLKVIDLKEGVVLPGIIDCHTHLGIIEEATGKIGMDNNESSEPVTPHLRGIDGINPLDIAFKDAVRAGVTCVMSGPGSNNVVGGQNAAIKTFGNIIDKMIVKNPLALKIALGENPLSCYGAKEKCPVTRMGVAALIRELFMRTQDYMANKESGNLKERDIKLEAVIPVLKGEIGLRAHAHRVDDIVTAIRIAEEFNIKKLVIEHGTEAHLIKEYLKERNIPVAFGPMLTPRIKMELKKRNYRSAAYLIEAGVKVALITDHPYNSIDQLRTVMILASTEGISKMESLRTITLRGAEILGCEDRIGKLKEGYDGDVVVFNGDPVDTNSKVLLTLVNGKIAYVDEDFNKESNIDFQNA